MDLFKKLDRVLDEETAGEAKAKPGDEKAPKERPLQRLKRAREAVEYAADLFVKYVDRGIVPRYPGLFKVARVDERDAYDTPAFGRLPPSAEHALARVTFKQINDLWVRFSAVILSDEMEVQTCYIRQSKVLKPEHRFVQLANHVQGGKVNWEGVFETVIADFVDWYGTVRG